MSGFQPFFFIIFQPNALHLALLYMPFRQGESISIKQCIEQASLCFSGMYKLISNKTIYCILFLFFLLG
jgi:hypothetical protein